MAAPVEGNHPLQPLPQQGLWMALYGDGADGTHSNMIHSFKALTEAGLRAWVEANPGRVEERDALGWTPLAYAANAHSAATVAWLIDEKGAKVDATMRKGDTALCMASTREALSVLLDRGANPILAGGTRKATPLMWHARYMNVECVKRLLQDPRVVATIDRETTGMLRGWNAMHMVCFPNIIDPVPPGVRARIVHLLLQAGANPTIVNASGEDALQLLLRYYPTEKEGAALLHQTKAEVETTSLLVKIRSLASIQACATSTMIVTAGRQTTAPAVEAGTGRAAAAAAAAGPAVAAALARKNTPPQTRTLTRGKKKQALLRVLPTYLQGRVGRGEPLPLLTFAASPAIEEEGEEEGKEEESREGIEQQRLGLRQVLGFVCGIEEGVGAGAEGGRGEGRVLPADVFKVVLDMLMPRWDPLHRPVGKGIGGITSPESSLWV